MSRRDIQIIEMSNPQTDWIGHETAFHLSVLIRASSRGVEGCSKSSIINQENVLEKIQAVERSAFDGKNPVHGKVSSVLNAVKVPQNKMI